jgi:hypothetical protein
MQVKIGPYKNWFGPYQIAEALCFWARKETDEYGFKHKPDWVHNFGTWLSGGDDRDSWLQRACLWIESKRSRKIKVRIDRWDTWSMDHTLSYIVLPMLRQLNKTKHGAPNTDDEDVPEHLRSTVAEPKENEWDTDSNHFLRWDWIMSEMIYAFECQLDDTWEDKYWTGEWGKPDFVKSDQEYPNPKTGVMESTYQLNPGTRKCDWDGLKLEQARIQNGFRLFGKYYTALWD